MLPFEHSFLATDRSISYIQEVFFTVTPLLTPRNNEIHFTVVIPLYMWVKIKQYHITEIKVDGKPYKIKSQDIKETNFQRLAKIIHKLSQELLSAKNLKELEKQKVICLKIATQQKNNKYTFSFEWFPAIRLYKRRNDQVEIFYVDINDIEHLYASSYSLKKFESEHVIIEWTPNRETFLNELNENFETFSYKVNRIFKSNMPGVSIDAMIKRGDKIF